MESIYSARFSFPVGTYSTKATSTDEASRLLRELGDK